MLTDHPADLRSRVELLLALRQASANEATTAPRVSINPGKVRKNPKKQEGDTETAVGSPAPERPANPGKDRLKGNVRASSVSSMPNKDGKETVTVKSEEGAEASKGITAEKVGQFVVGAEVVYKQPKKPGVEGDGIQCIIKAVIDGPKKRSVQLSFEKSRCSLANNSLKI